LGHSISPVALNVAEMQSRWKAWPQSRTAYARVPCTPRPWSVTGSRHTEQSGFCAAGPAAAAALPLPKALPDVALLEPLLELLFVVFLPLPALGNVPAAEAGSSPSRMAFARASATVIVADGFATAAVPSRVHVG
jgi:hypothetical protein